MKKKQFFIYSLLLFYFLFSCGNKDTKNRQLLEDIKKFQLSQENAYDFSQLALKCIQKEYPYKLGHVINSPEDIHIPKDMHPSFYGCFDWHSAVHGHWMLVKILKMYPDISNAKQIREAIDVNLRAENISQEVKYFQQQNRKSFERTYGWAWLLKLYTELKTWDDPQGRKWAENVLPLAQLISRRYVEFFPKQTYPIRRGVHANTAFGLSFALDYAEITKDKKMMNLLVKKAKEYYLFDKRYSAEWEPGGDDFLSPGLTEADLMRRILNTDQFSKWFDMFMPQVPDNILNPATVTDRSDPKIVHLDGLNLSRAWCMFGIASVLSDRNLKKDILINAGLKHLETGSLNILSGNYEGEHWLASFAIYACSSLYLLKE
ncbi:MAG: DUF2891 domain-containing protein [bacterium]